MANRLLIAVAAAASLAAGLYAQPALAAREEPRADAWQDPAASPDEAALSRIVNRIKTTREFLKAAAKVVAESGNRDAQRFMQLADEAAADGEGHYADGEYEFASLHMGDAMHMAVYAITIAKTDDRAAREAVVREAIVTQNKRENERMEAVIRKRRVEVASFILTAERILSEKGASPAKEKLDMARQRIETSTKFAAAGSLEEALSEINRAYQLATQSVKEMKETERFSVTFPKTQFASEREELKHESKKNDTYLFFAEQVVPASDAGLSSRLAEAREMRKAALALSGEQNAAEAIARLRESTKLLIMLIKDTANR